MSQRSRVIIHALAAVLAMAFAAPAEGQTRKKNPAPKRAASPPAVSPDVPAAVSRPAVEPLKRNERPATGVSLAKNQPNVDTEPVQPARSATPAYRYEFSQPDFIVSIIKIEHDEAGVGTIAFKKKGSDELITDPIRVSARALSRIGDALTALNFLESNENYQYEKDFSHLGSMKFARTSDGKTREVVFNYTANKDAKALMDEYRKIGNQYIWIFDITLARDNQPLESPKLLDALDSMIKRNEISDPLQMEPFLKELSNDERFPLIARNHAVRLIKQFEKEKAKEEKKKS